MITLTPEEDTDPTREGPCTSQYEVSDNKGNIIFINCPESGAVSRVSLIKYRNAVGNLNSPGDKSTSPFHLQIKHYYLLINMNSKKMPHHDWAWYQK